MLIILNIKLSWFEVLEFTGAIFVPFDNIHCIVHSENYQ